MRAKLVAAAAVTASSALLTGPAQADAAYWKGKRGNLGRRDRWRGTFHIRSVLRRNGRVIDRCRVKRVRWSARRVS